jgi:hypothetical protein
VKERGTFFSTQEENNDSLSLSVYYYHPALPAATTDKGSEEYSLIIIMHFIYNAYHI